MLSSRRNPVPGPISGKRYSGSKKISSVLDRTLDVVTKGLRERLSVCTFSSSSLIIHVVPHRVVRMGYSEVIVTVRGVRGGRNTEETHLI